MKSLQQTLQQNRALQCSTSASLCPAPDVELYSSTALQSALQLYSSTALQRSTLYILYTLPQLKAWSVELEGRGASRRRAWPQRMDDTQDSRRSPFFREKIYSPPTLLASADLLSSYSPIASAVVAHLAAALGAVSTWMTRKTREEVPFS